MHLRVSAWGWVALAVAVVAVPAGRALGWFELTALGSATGLAFMVGLLSAVGRPHLDVTLELPEQRVQLGQRIVGRVEVANHRNRRTLATLMQLPVGGWTAQVQVRSLRPGRTHDELFAVPTHRRAALTIGPVRLRRGDPLGLVRRDTRASGTLELLVHPRVVPLGGDRAGVLRDLEGQATRDLSDSDLSFHALREYVPGDDRRHIHWRTSAHLGTLMVRQFEDTRRLRTLVALATATREYAGDDEVELAVSVAASLAVHALREQRELSFLAGVRRVATPTPRAVLDECARLDVTPTGPRLLELPQLVAGQPASVAFLVGGSRTPLAELRTVARQAAAGMRVVMLTVHPGAELRVQHDGPVTTLVLGDLDALPRGLRRVVA